MRWGQGWKMLRYATLTDLWSRDEELVLVPCSHDGKSSRFGSG